MNYRIHPIVSVLAILLSDVVPSSAIRLLDGRQVVFVLQGDRLERRAIRAETHGSAAIVLSGLSAGESVVIEGPEELRDGQRVESH